MTSEEALLKKFKVLPTNRKQELLDFAEFLEQKESSKHPRRRSLYGIWSDLSIDITEEDFREAREEAWKNFPREHFFDTEEK